MKKLTLVPVVALLLVVALPDLLAACPVCFDRDDEARIAFIATTGLLTALPLSMVGGVAYWLRRRSRNQDVGESFSEDG